MSVREENHYIKEEKHFPGDVQVEEKVEKIRSQRNT